MCLQVLRCVQERFPKTPCCELQEKRDYVAKDNRKEKDTCDFGACGPRKVPLYTALRL